VQYHTIVLHLIEGMNDFPVIVLNIEMKENLW